MMTAKQSEYYRLYLEGFTMKQIADKKGVNKSTVSRTIHRATEKRCPFGRDCKECPLDDCGIKEEYSYFVNEKRDFRRVDGYC